MNETTANTPARPLSPLNGESSGGGEQYPALFGLGAGRTLTLVNGRRYVTSSGSFSSAGFGSSTNDSVVDTNMIPIGLLKSVEIVQGGGAAVYGSDAMGGVINYIFKDDFEGLEFDAQYGQSSRGDYESPSARVTWGMNFADRGNVAVNVEWSRTEPLYPTDRQHATRALVSTANPANSGNNDGRPSVLPVVDPHFWEFNESGVLFARPIPRAFRIDSSSRSMALRMAMAAQRRSSMPRARLWLPTTRATSRARAHRFRSRAVATVTTTRI